MIENNLKDDPKILAQVKSIPTLKSLGESSLIGLLEKSKIREYQPGEVIIQEGTFDSYIFYLFNGRVIFMKKDKVIGSLRRPGDVFGQMAVIDGAPRSASVIADGKAVCILIDMSSLRNLMKQSQTVDWHRINEILTARLNKRTEDYWLSKEMIRWILYEVQKLNTPIQ